MKYILAITFSQLVDQISSFAQRGESCVGAFRYVKEDKFKCDEGMSCGAIFPGGTTYYDIYKEHMKFMNIMSIEKLNKIPVIKSDAEKAGK